MKHGPPMSAVITPTGISVGAITVLARASQRTRNAPPSSKHEGITILLSRPEIFLTM